MSDIILVDKCILLSELKQIAALRYGDMVKAVVDIEKQVIAVGGEMHADEEQFLLEKGSSQNDLWGINIYPDLNKNDWIGFDSMINIRPKQGNRSRGVEDAALQEKIKQIVASLIKN